MQIAAPRVWRYNQKRRKHLGEVGKIIGFSVIRVGPWGLEQRTPYVVGLVEVGGEKLIAQIVDVETSEIRIGMKVVGVLRRMFGVNKEGVIVYGVKFSPERNNEN